MPVRDRHLPDILRPTELHDFGELLDLKRWVIAVVVGFCVRHGIGRGLRDDAPSTGSTDTAFVAINGD